MAAIHGALYSGAKRIAEGVEVHLEVGDAQPDLPWSGYLVLGQDPAELGLDPKHDYRLELDDGRTARIRVTSPAGIRGFRHSVGFKGTGLSP
ncbi:MAG: hypothetical protein ACODAJ_13000 [Planctomycetota bacterium]